MFMEKKVSEGIIINIGIVKKQNIKTRGLLKEDYAANATQEGITGYYYNGIEGIKEGVTSGF